MRKKALLHVPPMPDVRCLAGLRPALEALGMSISTLARALRVDEAAVHYWMKGGFPKTPRLVQLAQLLDVPLDVLILGARRAAALRRKPALSSPIPVGRPAGGHIEDEHLELPQERAS